MEFNHCYSITTILVLLNVMILQRAVIINAFILKPHPTAIPSHHHHPCHQLQHEQQSTSYSHLHHHHKPVIAKQSHFFPVRMINRAILSALLSILPFGGDVLLGGDMAAAASPSIAPATCMTIAASTTTKDESSSIAAANLPEDVIATGIVELGKNANLDRLKVGTPALFITARVGQKGRVLASIKVRQPASFPICFEIREENIYADAPEARHEIAQSIMTQDLVISARLDKDGQASTRDAEDMVGQGRLYKFNNENSAQWSRAEVELTGRGAFGEFVTAKKR